MVASPALDELGNQTKLEPRKYCGNKEIYGVILALGWINFKLVVTEPLL